MSSLDVAKMFTPNLNGLLALVASFGTAATVVIDGPSGAGKSTVADYLVANWPTDAHATAESAAVQLVRLDDIYPGWSSLASGAAVAQGILKARSGGEVGSWQRYDWSSSALTTWHDVHPDAPLILEGCGALSEHAVSSADLRLWVTVDEGVRRERALSRGGEDFESHWDEWDVQFAAHTARENPRRFANMILVATQ